MSNQNGVKAITTGGDKAGTKTVSAKCPECNRLYSKGYNAGLLKGKKEAASVIEYYIDKLRQNGIL